jgi:PAS domain S-box-containing protein
MTSKSEGIKSQYPKIIGLLLVFASLVAIVALYALDITFLYEPKHLLGVTNTIFTAIIPIIVSFFAARIYLRSGSFNVLLMGCGMLGFGLCAGSAGWLREIQGGANFNVTIYNTGALLGSLCHITGAVINYSRKSYPLEPRKQGLVVIPAYSAIIVFAVLLSFATVQQVIPQFFIQGSGPTALRQIVLGLAILLYATSSLLFMNNYLRMKSDFLYWYALCLAMFALGLFAFYIERIVGSPIGWVGRTSNYVGAIFSLIAVWAAIRSGKSRGLPLEEVISSFFVDAEANYKSLVETASDAIISFDEENRVILWNSSAEKIFGYTNKEATGLPLFGTFIPEEYANALKGLTESSQGASSQETVEIAGRHKNGGLFPIEISAFGRKLPNGLVGTCILRDITERRRTEETLRGSEEHYRSLFDNMLNGYAYCRMLFEEDESEDFIYLNVNRAFETLTGLENVIGKKVSEVIPGIRESDPGLFEIYGRVARTGIPERFETYLEALGQWFSISVYSPRKEHFVAVFDVITERKRAEERLKEYEKTVEGLEEMIAVVDRDYRYLIANRAFLNYRDMDRGQVVGRSAAVVLDKEVFEKDVKPKMDESFQGNVIKYEMKYNYPTLGDRDLFISYFPIEGLTGIDRVACVLQDITERKQMEKELRRSHDDLEWRIQERTAELELVNEKLRLLPSTLIEAQENERKRLAGDLHDSIGQTLAALKFRIEHVITTLEKRESEQAVQLLHEFVPILQRSIEETRAIYMGLKPTTLSEYGILATLEWYRLELLKLYPNQHIELEIAIREEDIPEDLKTAIFRIVQEALNNTFKHGEPEWVDVRLAVHDGAIELEISDDGIGMNLDYIMESRAAKSLGLIGMRERAELTRGEFTIRSAPNEGTTVKAVWRNHSNTPRATSY